MFNAHLREIGTIPEYIRKALRSHAFSCAAMRLKTIRRTSQISQDRKSGHIRSSSALSSSALSYLGSATSHKGADAFIPRLRLRKTAGVSERRTDIRVLVSRMPAFCQHFAYQGTYDESAQTYIAFLPMLPLRFKLNAGTPRSCRSDAGLTMLPHP